MKTTNQKGETMAFIMEPEEELAAVRFIALHKPSRIVVVPDELFNSDFSPAEIAEELGLRGGYDINFRDIRGGIAYHE